MQYFYTVKDRYGYIHSIDNCIIHYHIKDSKSQFIDYLHDLKKIHHLDNEYWENLNNKPCSHFQYFLHNVHLCDGVYMNIGKYDMCKDKDYQAIMNIVRLEVNLNKHYQKDCLSDLIEYLKYNSWDIELIKYDYAIDIPVSPEKVEVFGSKKEKGLYKGTRSYGQRNKHGRCKIYDKRKEQNLDYDLTRIEHTIEVSRCKKGYSLENVYIQKQVDHDLNMKDTDISIIKMLSALKNYGEDIEKYIEMLGRKKKQHIKECLNNCEYVKYEYDMMILDDLLAYIQKYIGYKEKVPMIYEDDQGFLKVNPESDDLPFE